MPAVWKMSKWSLYRNLGETPTAKAFRPISLSSLLLKVMEKLLEKHLREICLIERPLHLNQHAYQSGRSCETVLHQLVSRIEKSLNNQEIALGAFLDIEGASDNASFESMILAASNLGVDNTCCWWLRARFRLQCLMKLFRCLWPRVAHRVGYYPHSCGIWWLTTC
jgi:hypothetical protein